MDNGSNDGSVPYLRSAFPSVKVIPTGKNLGFAGGNNVGFTHAQGSLIALLNNDTAVDPRWLESLVTAMHDDTRIGATTSKILLMEEPDTINNVGLNLYRDGSGGDRGFYQQDQGQFRFTCRSFRSMWSKRPPAPGDAR